MKDVVKPIVDRLVARHVPILLEDSWRAITPMEAIILHWNRINALKSFHRSLRYVIRQWCEGLHFSDNRLLENRCFLLDSLFFSILLNSLFPFESLPIKLLHNFYIKFFQLLNLGLTRELEVLFPFLLKVMAVAESD